MSITREHIGIAAKLYECQETAKMFFKEEYESKITWYRDTIKQVMEKRKEDALKSVLAICQLDIVKDNGMAVMLFMAAAVDIVEAK